jgi:septal ring factor EnvC (AmiA/AmiB activator)
MKMNSSLPIKVSHNCLFVIIGHMKKVKHEISFLKNKADEQKLMKDAEIKDLENEIRWFKNESQKLNETYQLQEKEIRMMKNKKSTVKDDTKFLKDQVKG